MSCDTDKYPKNMRQTVSFKIKTLSETRYKS